jgi:hypothetical protein
MAAWVTTTAAPTLRYYEVTQNSGQKIMVQGQAEKKFYEQTQAKYRSENAFTAVADLNDLDRLLFLELMTYRWTTWLSGGRNYHGEILTTSEETEMRRSIRETTPLISTIKNDLGLTKSQRDKDQYESVGSYIVKLKARAMEHGIHRNNQVNKALSLINELFAMIGAYDRSDTIERAKLGLDNADDILDWIRTTMRPEFDEIDAKYRATQQKTWVREL